MLFYKERVSTCFVEKLVLFAVSPRENVLEVKKQRLWYWSMLRVFSIYMLEMVDGDGSEVDLGPLQQLR